jgi:hypothetical protein
VREGRGSEKGRQRGGGRGRACERVEGGRGEGSESMRQRRIESVSERVRGKSKSGIEKGGREGEGASQRATSFQF